MNKNEHSSDPPKYLGGGANNFCQKVGGSCLILSISGGPNRLGGMLKSGTKVLGADGGRSENLIILVDFPNP